MFDATSHLVKGQRCDAEFRFLMGGVVRACFSLVLQPTEPMFSQISDDLLVRIHIIFNTLMIRINIANL